MSQKYADAQALAERYDVQPATIWRWVKDKRIPAPIQLSPGCTRWRLDEIEAVEAERAAARSDAA